MTAKVSKSRPVMEKTSGAPISGNPCKGSIRAAVTTAFALFLGVLCCGVNPARTASDCLVPGGWISYIAQGEVTTMRPDGWHKSASPRTALQPGPRIQ